MRITSAVVLWVTVLSAATSSGQTRDTLDIYVIDVEGGEATLFVAPSGESMLVDTGWPGFDGRDADRIVAAAQDAGVTRIDHLIVTHFHTDHMGGAAQLADRLPIVNYLDHGTTVDVGERPRAAFDRYVTLRRGATHRTVAPGDLVPIDGLDVRIIAADGAVLTSALPGAGRPNPHCEGFTLHGEDILSRYGDAEDQRSVSAVIGFGQFRSVIMGDLTWNQEQRATQGWWAVDVRQPDTRRDPGGPVAEPLRGRSRRRQSARVVHRESPRLRAPDRERRR